MQLDKVRIDKFLWGIRLYKTRTMATEACDSGRIKMDGDAVKPSKMIKRGDTINIKIEYHTKTIKVIDLLERRVSAPLAQAAYEDLTPIELRPENLKQLVLQSSFYRDRGTGRPTKRDRREIDEFQDNNEE